MPRSIKGLTIEEAAVIRGRLIDEAAGIPLECKKKKGNKTKSQGKERHILCGDCQEGKAHFRGCCCGYVGSCACSRTVSIADRKTHTHTTRTTSSALYFPRVLAYNQKTNANGYTGIALEDCPRCEAYLVELGVEFALERCGKGMKRRQMDRGQVAFERDLKTKLIHDKVFASGRISSEFVAKVISVAQQQLTEGSNLGPPTVTPGDRPPAVAAAGVRPQAVSVQTSAVEQQQLKGGSGNTGPPAATPGVRPSAAAPTTGLAAVELSTQPSAAPITGTAAGNQAWATKEQIDKLAAAATAGVVGNQQAIQSLTATTNDFAGHVKTAFTRVEQRLDEQGRRLDGHEQRLDEQGRRLDGQGRRLDGHEQRLDEQGRRLDGQGRQVEDHGQRLDGHSQRISQVDANMRSFGGQVESAIGSLDQYNRAQDECHRGLKRRFNELDQSMIKGFASFERSRDANNAAVDKQLADQKAKGDWLEQRHDILIDAVDEKVGMIGGGFEELQRSLRKTARKVQKQSRKLATVCDQLGITDM